MKYTFPKLALSVALLCFAGSSFAQSTDGAMHNSVAMQKSWQMNTAKDTSSASKKDTTKSKTDKKSQKDKSDSAGH